MLAIVCVYVITNASFFLLPRACYLLILLFLIFLSLKVPRAFVWVLLSMFLFSLNSNVLLLINSFVSKNFNNMFVFYSGISIFLIAILYGFTAALFLGKGKNSKNFHGYKPKVFFVFMCAFTIVHIDHFAYNKALFLMVLIGIICIIKILFSKHDLISPSLFGKGFIFLSLFSVVALTTTVSLIAGNHEAKVVVWPEERGVWANTEEKYNTRDFTLKTSYSYSLLKEFMNRKYHLINTTDLSSLDPTKE